MTNSEMFNAFVKDLSEVIQLPQDRLARFAEILDDRIKELATEQANDALDREFNRGDYRY